MNAQNSLPHIDSRDYRVHYVRCPENSNHFILADATAPGWKRPPAHPMMTQCVVCGHIVTTTAAWKTGYALWQERDELKADREPQPEPDNWDAVTGLIAVEDRSYKGLGIEVEIYRRSDGSGYYPWPYIIKYHQHGSSAQHFYPNVGRFATKEDALNVAIQEARQRIDDGFDPTQLRV